jgi:hypothetical protein
LCHGAERPHAGASQTVLFGCVDAAYLASASASCTEGDSGGAPATTAFARAPVCTAVPRCGLKRARPNYLLHSRHGRVIEEMRCRCRLATHVLSQRADCVGPRSGERALTQLRDAFRCAATERRGACHDKRASEGVICKRCDAVRLGLPEGLQPRVGYGVPSAAVRSSAASCPACPYSGDS